MYAWLAGWLAVSSWYLHLLLAFVSYLTLPAKQTGVTEIIWLASLLAERKITT